MEAVPERLSPEEVPIECELDAVQSLKVSGMDVDMVERTDQIDLAEVEPCGRRTNE
jgi:hypothetical protein